MSEFSRETLLNIIETDHVQCGEASALARMALAAMGSEPSRNPVLAYADSYRDMAKQGVESVPIWSVITDLERNIAPLYRHAQQPVVPDDIKLRELFDSWFASDCSFDRSPEASEEDNIAWRESYWYVWQRCRAAMLQAGTLTNEGETILHNYRTAMEGIGHIRRTLEETFGGLHGTHVEPDVLMECKTICDAIYAAYRGSAQGVPEEKLMPNSLSMYAVDAVAAIAEVRGWNAFRAATLQAGNSPVIPEWIPVSERMPEKNGTYQVWNGEHVGAVPFLFGSFQCLNPEQVTHWMPTAKPPREVK